MKQHKTYALILIMCLVLFAGHALAQKNTPVAPAKVPDVNTTTPAPQLSDTSTPSAHKLTAAPVIPTPAGNKDRISTEGILQIVIGILGLVVMIAIAFGIFDRRQLRKENKELKRQIEKDRILAKEEKEAEERYELKKQVEEALRKAVDADKRSEKVEKMSTEVNAHTERAARQAEEASKIVERLKQIQREVEEGRDKFKTVSLKEPPSEEVEKQLDELKDKIEMLESFGLTLSSEDYFNKGNDLYFKGDKKNALKAYEKSIELQPNNATVWVNKGAVLTELGRYEEALEAAKRAIELKPDSANATYNKGLALAKLGRYEEALKAYEKAIELQPNNATVWSNKGVSLAKLGRYEETLKAYEKAIELQPNYANAWYNKGATLGDLGRHEKALKAYEKAIELEPNDADAWFSRACVYALMGKKKDALRDLAKAIELDGNYKKMAPEDKDFESLRDDPDFISLTKE